MWTKAHVLHPLGTSQDSQAKGHTFAVLETVTAAMSRGSRKQRPAFRSRTVSIIASLRVGSVTSKPFTCDWQLAVGVSIERAANVFCILH